jgi:D-serine deaminase-like pyridoxal phosphate-dependent protein
MAQQAPAMASEVQAGMRLDEIPTPAVLVDIDQMERNLVAWQSIMTARGKRFRPHVKTHKIPKIALRQQALGACGIAASKPSEAAPFHQAGCRDIVIAYPSVGIDKWSRLARMARDAHVATNVDSDEQARGLSEAAVAEGVTVGAQIEIDSGFHRVGIELAAFDQIAAFARLLMTLPGVDFEGITTHRGKFDERLAKMTNDEAGMEEGQILVDLADRLRDVGIPVREVTAGGTMTGRGVAMVDGVTEVRAGTYVFFDAMQVSFGAAQRADVAVSIISTVVSRRRAGWATIDAGTKTFSGDRGVTGSGAPGAGVVAEAVDVDAAVMRLTEEHGMVCLGEGVTVEIGQRIQFTPFHVCTAVNLSNELVATRNGVVEEVWPVLARGCRT